MRVLFCQLRSYGDIIRTFPLMDAVKKYHPDWYIGYTCFPEMEEVCRLCTSIDVIIPQPRLTPIFDSRDGTRLQDCTAFGNCVHQVRNQEFDLYVDLHGVFQSAMFGAMCNISRRLGRSEETSKDGAYLFYTDICFIKNREINRMERHFMVLNSLFPEIHPLENGPRHGDYIIIFPGSSQKGILKRYSLRCYAEIARRLASKYRVLFALGPEESRLYSDLECLGDFELRFFESWKDIYEVMSGCKLALGNDGAYLHLAIWAHVTTVMICGPLSPMVNGVWRFGVGSTVYKEHDCVCDNVWKGGCAHNHKCLESISSSEVLSVVNCYL